MIKILVVEDDKALNKTVCTFLNLKGYEATGVFNAADAYDRMEDVDFNLVISDIMMPQIDGYEFAKEIRKIFPSIPIIFMTAREDIESKIKGFESGIDDYMVKPLLLPELQMRIEAILRRSRINTEKKLIVGSLKLDSEEHSAYIDGEEVTLTVREFDLIYKLLSYPKKTFTRLQLMSEFWDSESEASPRVVDVYITKLRDKLSACSDFEIQTVHGLGYKAVINKQGTL
ncbi:MAG: response regulator transcription factor [Sphaerochaetaceae bacterium]|nr:response regulator transcription factor [Sphaerochaetaceae bacterium]